MDLPLNFQPGWVSDPARVSEVIAMREDRGDAVFALNYAVRNAVSLPGTWARLRSQGFRGIFLRDREIQLMGRNRRAFLQRRGTCVARGMCRGIQVTHDAMIVDRSQLLVPVEFTFATIYTMARHEFGHDRCGSGDGAILADAARAVHDHGVATTKLFEGMSEDDIERLACKYAAPGVGTPAAWLQAAQGHTCPTFLPDSLELLFDCIAAGYAVPYAHRYVTGQPNSKGISGLGSFGPHCRCFTGVFLDENGETQLESSESWGRFPAGQANDADQTMPVESIPRIKLKWAGGEKSLAPGSVGVYAKQFWSEIQSGGEAWAVGAAKYQANSVADTTVRRSVV